MFVCVNRLLRGKGVSIFTDVDPDHDEGIYFETHTCIAQTKLNVFAFVNLIIQAIIYLTPTFIITLR